MYFDKFDICEAYYLWLSHHYNGMFSKEYERLCKMDKYFKLGAGHNGNIPTTENATEIYNNLCIKKKCEHELLEVSE